LRRGKRRRAARGLPKKTRTRSHRIGKEKKGDRKGKGGGEGREFQSLDGEGKPLRAELPEQRMIRARFGLRERDKKKEKREIAGFPKKKREERPTIISHPAKKGEEQNVSVTRPHPLA